MNMVLEFINKRFPTDCNWTTGNCYYFALILADRFNGDIYYDVINGHFITKIQDNFYDWNGIVNTNNCLVEWNKMDQYDSLVKQRIIRDCIH